MNKPADTSCTAFGRRARQAQCRGVKQPYGLLQRTSQSTVRVTQSCVSRKGKQQKRTSEAAQETRVETSGPGRQDTTVSLSKDTQVRPAPRHQDTKGKCAEPSGGMLTPDLADAPCGSDVSAPGLSDAYISGSTPQGTAQAVIRGRCMHIL